MRSFLFVLLLFFGCTLSAQKGFQMHEQPLKITLKISEPESIPKDHHTLQSCMHDHLKKRPTYYYNPEEDEKKSKLLGVLVGGGTGFLLGAGIGASSTTDDLDTAFTYTIVGTVVGMVVGYLLYNP